MQQLDLADLSSIKAAGEALAASLPRLDLLILNAGVMACPQGRTKDGVEMQVWCGWPVLQHPVAYAPSRCRRFSHCHAPFRPAAPGPCSHLPILLSHRIN